MATQTVSLKINITKTNNIKTMQFEESMMVFDACRLIRERVPDAVQGQPTECGLFKPDEDPTKGRWLEMGRTLEYYHLKSGQHTLARDQKKLDKLKKELHTDDECVLNWLNSDKSLREQGISETAVLTLRKRFFFSDQNVDRNDPVQLNLIYVQSKNAIIDGTHPCTREEAVQFAALQCQIQYGTHNEAKHKPGFLNLDEFLPEEYVKFKGIEKLIWTDHRKLHYLNELNAMFCYIQLCRSLRTYGVTFLVKEKLKGRNKLVPRLLGITRESIMRVDETTKEVLKTWPLTTVCRLAASPNSFTLNFVDYSESFFVQTTEGEIISQLIAGYIDIIMQKKQPVNTDVADDDDTAVVVENEVLPSRNNVNDSEDFGEQNTIDNEDVCNSRSKQGTVTAANALTGARVESDGHSKSTNLRRRRGTNVRAANKPTEAKVKGVGPAKCAGDGPAEENGPEGNRPSDSEKSTTLRRRKGNELCRISSLLSEVSLALVALISIQLFILLCGKAVTSTTDLYQQIKILSGERYTYNWKHGGFKMDVPNDCLPEFVAECTLHVTASLGTNILLPNNTALVSSVYHIVQPPNVQQFKKPITIHIQHCVDFKPGDEDKLSFVIAKEGSTNFKFLPGGSFSFNSKYGSITLDSFSFVGIASKGSTPPDIEYCGSVYYTNIDQDNNYHEVDFVVNKNLPGYIQATSKRYSFMAHSEVYFKFRSLQDTISLQIPEIDDGWNCMPLIQKLVNKTVYEFKEGLPLPRLKLGIKKTTDNASSDNIGFKVIISGTEDNAYFVVLYTPPALAPRKDEYYIPWYWNAAFAICLSALYWCRLKERWHYKTMMVLFTAIAVYCVIKYGNSFLDYVDVMRKIVFWID